jgi:tetraacyldisaccharide 4'-kinase
VRAGINIVLTDYSNLFTRDWFLPTGDLRDNISSYKRADILVVTKCPGEMTATEKESITKEINPLSHQHLFFTTIHYGQPYHIVSGNGRTIKNTDEILLVSGIANPKPLKKYLADNCEAYYEILYEDHHIFSIDDWKDMQKRFNSISSENKIILTTEKDAVRLMKFQQSMDSYPFYVLPMKVYFLFGEEHAFTDLIIKFIAGFINKNENNQVLQ